MFLVTAFLYQYQFTPVLVAEVTLDLVSSPSETTPARLRLNSRQAELLSHGGTLVARWQSCLIEARIQPNVTGRPRDEDQSLDQVLALELPVTASISGECALGTSVTGLAEIRLARVVAFRDVLYGR